MMPKFRINKYGLLLGLETNYSPLNYVLVILKFFLISRNFKNGGVRAIRYRRIDLDTVN